jgi:hypothetical protein
VELHEFVDSSPVDDDSLATDVSPHRLRALQPCTDLFGSDLENLDPVPGDPAHSQSPLPDRIRPRLVGLVDAHGTDEHGVDVARCVRLSPRVGTEDDHRLRFHGQYRGNAPHLLDYGIARSRKREQRTCCDMLGNKPEQ